MNLKRSISKWVLRFGLIKVKTTWSQKNICILNRDYFEGFTIYVTFNEFYVLSCTPKFMY
jgi:hypothetical protein